VANITPKQAVGLLRGITAGLEAALEAELPLALLDMEADIKRRIFLNGLDANGTKIGSYSTEPIYVSIKGAKKRYGSQIPTSKLKGKGKADSSKSKFKNGNSRRSQYFKDGYSGFRKLMDRDTSTVNLDLTSNLQNSILTGTNGNIGTIEFISGNLKTGDVDGQTLAGYLEEHFGDKKIFSASQGEVDLLNQALEQAANEYLQRFLP
jgi:hypothetical protein